MKNFLRTITVIPLLFFSINSFAFNESSQEFTQAEKYFESGNYKQSEQFYRQAADKYKGMGNLSAYIQNRIGECLQYQGRTEEAVQAYRKVQAEHPQSPQAVQAQEQVARAYYQAGDYAKAAPEFEKLAWQAETENEKASVAASGNEKKVMNENSYQNDSLEYAAYCHNRNGDVLKASLLARKIKKKNMLKK